MKKFTHEAQNYPWLTIENSKTYYYLPEPIRTLNFGYFKLEDTGDIFKVTGINPDVQPMCLDFEKNTDNVSAFDFLMPVAKIVPKKVLND